MHVTDTMNPISVSVQFRHLPTSQSIKRLAYEQTERLERFCSRGGHCKVVIDETQHWNKGGVLKVSVRFKVPGERLYVAIVEQQGTSYEFLHSMIRQAFDETERQLKKQHAKHHRRRMVEVFA